MRGAIHSHGLRKLKSDPSLRDLSKVAVEGFKASEKLKLFSGESLNFQKTIDLGKKVEQVICKYSDLLLNTCNPDLEWEKPSLHPCHLAYSEIDDFELDYANLVNSVQRHTKCNSGYCLRLKDVTKSKDSISPGIM